MEVVIEAVGGEGDGIAAGPLYAPFTLPGERVRLAAGGERRELEAVLEASPQRVVPPCPHFGVCGGCALQHWEHSAYLAWKVDRLVRTLARERIETEVLPAFAASPGSRRRVSLHARPGRKDAARLGFKGRKSWDVIDITACTIADPRLVAALPALRRLAVPLFEHSKSAPTLHVTVTDTGIDVDISGVERKSGGLSADARMRLAEIAGEADFARVTLDGEMAYLARQPVVRLGEATVALPAGGFLQAVPEAEVAMAQMAAEAASGAERIADLFCGSGTFTFRLAKIAPVLALDGEAPAIRALSAALASAPGLHGVVAEARDLTRRPLLAEEMKRIDTVVFDPPRAGAYEQCTEIARSKVARAIAVSCNPATFVRDARILIDAGFTLDKLLPVDQFLWSPHVELVGVFSR
ncbi:MAG: class I SAM-dependent RNA methyltransferase [Pseudomonadota bacterium]|uniref:class I SAM-dependent RNA methyltransferase n=1 Tax=unclassified Phenylobacterium TaxID=2640670 RepID=UPI0006F303F2|nr:MULTISPECIES: class I SAM-dependent RNA methyltransferase [unclassified Phenylobacterium]KRB40033.1 RNA methyltransferase [Phenylobacterium sp. Root700]